MKKIQNIFTAEGETERSGLDLLRHFSQPTTFISGVLPISDGTTRTAALIAGDVDFIERVAPADLPNLASRSGITVFKSVSNRLLYLTLHMTIMCDQLRYDYLGCTGHPHIRTRFIRHELGLAQDRLLSVNNLN